MPSTQLKANPTTQLAKNIVSLRKQMGFTTAEVAEAIGMSRTSMRDIESGRVLSPSFINVVRLARFFGVDATDLYDGDLSMITEKETTLNYIQSNFDEADWRYLINMVSGRRKDQMLNGYFTSIHTPGDED